MVNMLPGAVLLSFLASAAVWQKTPSAGEVAAALQRKYDTIHDFSADFTHRHQSGVLRRTRVEQGSLLVKKPGRMRWEYKSPEQKLFVSDGARIYFHDVANKQVTVSEVPVGEQAASAALFLAGNGNLARDFSASFMEGGGPDSYALRLEPKSSEAEYDWLEIVVDRDTLRIQSITAAQQDGGRDTFEFSNLKENVGLADKTFEFKIPPGVEVINTARAKL
jgi:outer membrane lipoprotein carrier protein